jgi:hypothetical protein
VGKDYHDESRLRLDAAEITETYPGDAFPGHSAWQEWPWKLHRIEAGAAKEGKKKKKAADVVFELYNLEDDPMEETDVAAEQPDRVKAMRMELEAWLGTVVDSLNGEDYE